MLQWLHGPNASAVRMTGSEHWVIFNANERPRMEASPSDPRSPKRALHLGLILQLKRLRNESRNKAGASLSSVRKKTNGRIFFGIFASLFALSFGLGIFWLSLHFPIRTLQSTAKILLDLPITFWATLQALLIIEWLTLKSAFSKGSPLMEWHVISFRIHRVGWELGPLVPQAIALILIVFAILVSSGCFALTGNITASGVFLAAWFYFILIISPFGAGPASHIYNRVLGTERILQIQDQFLLGMWIDPSQALKGRPSWISIGAAFSLIAWVLLVTASFGWIADALSNQLTLPMLVLQLLSNILGMTFGIWMIFKMFAFLRQNSVLRRAEGALTFQPSQNDLTLWKNSCAILHHLPELASLPWEWHWYKAGTMLVRRGETSREFFWMASGEASVLGLDANYQNVQFAQLYGGSGFGEIVFLRGGQRNADVYLRSDSIVASLHFDALSPIITAEMRETLEMLVLASQAMDISNLFCAMPSYAKEEWIRNGKLCKAKQGDTLIFAGSDEKWMGMVVHGGTMLVEREGYPVTNLAKGGIFGEMAYWTNSQRTASITAQGDVTYLRWEPEFWAAQAQKHGIQGHLNRLIHQRNNQGESK